ncbi:MAG: ABC transporter substrate-binding protein [Armatimonadota bacterium]|nr:ABC transporter substrate-binding protein [Armatimonadota bacterium]
MTKLSLTLACWDYDRTRPLMDGRVQAEGLDLNLICLPVEEIFWRQVRHQEFDVSEFSLAYLTHFRSRGDWEYVGIPVFLSRMFRHGCVYINTRAGIRCPQDLAGKPVGLPAYQMTATVWVRGLFQHEYGLPPERVTWLYSREDIFPFDPPPGLSLRRIGPGQSLSAMLEAGEIVALITARKPEAFVTGSGAVGRLFPDYRAAEEDYFRRTGIFPIMHTLVVRAEIARRHPWVPQSLYKAFDQARQLCYQDMAEAAALKYSLPWLLDEVERTQRLMGQDFWPYGLEPNRRALETLVRYAHEQGLAARLIPIEQLFAEGTLDQYSIW